MLKASILMSILIVISVIPAVYAAAGTIPDQQLAVDFGTHVIDISHLDPTDGDTGYLFPGDYEENSLTTDPTGIITAISAPTDNPPTLTLTSISGAAGSTTVTLVLDNGDGGLPTYSFVVDVGLYTIVPTESSPTNSDSVEFTVNFGTEIDPDSFMDVDITKTNAGNIENITSVDSTNESFTFDVETANDGELTVSIAANRVTDPDGTDIAAQSNTASITVDKTGPTPTFSDFDTDFQNSRIISFEVNFGEPINPETFRIDSITLSPVIALLGEGAQVTTPVAHGGTNQIFRFNVETNASYEGEVTVSMEPNSVQDVPGNNNMASNTASVEIDTTPPAPFISATNSSMDFTLIEFTVNFGNAIDPVTFTLNDIEHSSGTRLNLLNDDAGANIIFTFEIENPDREQSLEVYIGANSVDDLAVNQNTRSNTESIAIPLESSDLVTTGPSPTNSHIIPYSITFPNLTDPADFTADMIMTSSGDIQGPAPVDNLNVVFTFNVTNPNAGLLEVSIPDETAHALGFPDGLAPIITVIDRIAPVPVIVTTEQNPTDSTLIPFTVSFKDQIDPDTFTLNSINTSSGTVQRMVE